MKVWSDTLTAQDLKDCGRGPVAVWRCEGPMPARVRSQVFDVVLTGTSPRGRNSGRYGGERTEYAPPATWDEHGEWMSRVFDIDPDARIANYKGREDFHAQTRYQYGDDPSGVMMHQGMR